MFAAITVVIALLGLLLLGLSFMQGVALGAATAVLATMFAALTIIPALIGGSGNFIDGVLHEFDARGGFRFWGTKRRLPIPGSSAARPARRAPRAPAGRGRRLGALVARGPAPAVARRRRLADGAHPAWRCRRRTCAWAPATPASTRPGRRRATPTT